MKFKKSSPALTGAQLKQIEDAFRVVERKFHGADFATQVHRVYRMVKDSIRGISSARIRKIRQSQLATAS